ncbi:MAG TPA: hypothetical protein DCS19_01700 [Flavobacterium sp.]|nr:hypothetical protein [Flavobacterium sp.]
MSDSIGTLTPEFLKNIFGDLKPPKQKEMTEQEAIHALWLEINDIADNYEMLHNIRLLSAGRSEKGKLKLQIKRINNE